MLKTFLKILYGSPKMYHKDKGEITESTGGGDQWKIKLERVILRMGVGF